MKVDLNVYVLASGVDSNAAVRGTSTPRATFVCEHVCACEHALTDTHPHICTLKHRNVNYS